MKIRKFFAMFMLIALIATPFYGEAVSACYDMGKCANLSAKTRSWQVVDEHTALVVAGGGDGGVISVVAEVDGSCDVIIFSPDHEMNGGIYYARSDAGNVEAFCQSRMGGNAAYCKGRGAENMLTIFKKGEDDATITGPRYKLLGIPLRSATRSLRQIGC